MNLINLKTRLLQRGNYNTVEHLGGSFFAKIVNGVKSLIIFAKNSIVDVRLGSKYNSVVTNY